MDHDTLHERLSAYVDGELDAEDTRAVENLLRESEEARAALRRLERATGLLRELPRHAAPPTIAEDILARIERQALLDDPTVPGLTVPSRGRAGLWRWSMAAGLVLSVTAGMWAFTTLRRDYRERQTSVAMATRESEERPSSKMAAKDSERETGLLNRRTETHRTSRTPVSTTPPGARRNGIAGAKTPTPEALDHTTTTGADHSRTPATKGKVPEDTQEFRRESRTSARLRIEVADARQRDLVVDQLSKQLQAASVPPVSELAGDSRTESTTTRSPSARFHEGRRIAQGERGAEARSLVVQAPPGVISRLAEQTARANPSSRVQLETNGAEFVGLAATQSQLLVMATPVQDLRPSERRRMRADAEDRDGAVLDRSQSIPKRGHAPKDHSDESSTSLWSAFGLKPDILEALLPRESAESKDPESVVAAGPPPPLAPMSPMERKADSDLVGPPELEVPGTEEGVFSQSASTESFVDRRLRELDGTSRNENASGPDKIEDLREIKPDDRTGMSKSSGSLPGDTGSSPGSSDGLAPAAAASSNELELDAWPAEATIIDVIIEIVPVAPATIDPASAPSSAPTLTPDTSPRPASKPRGTS